MGLLGKPSREMGCDVTLTGNFLIQLARFRAHGNTLFLSRKRALIETRQRKRTHGKPAVFLQPASCGSLLATGLLWWSSCNQPLMIVSLQPPSYGGPCNQPLVQVVVVFLQPACGLPPARSTQLFPGTSAS